MDRLPAESPPAAPGVTVDSPAAVGAIDGRHSGDLLRLQRLLEHGDGFQLVFALCLSITYRQRIIDDIAVRHPAATTVDLHDASDPSALLDALRERAAERQPIHVVGVESWLRRAGAPALQALNYRRESLAAAVRRTLVVWLEPGTITRFAREAPDLWAWREGVLDFSHPPPQRAAVHQQAIFIGSAERRERERRLAEIAAHLQSVADLAGADAGLLLEASEIEQALGHPEAAMAYAEAARAIFRRIDDRRGEAFAAGRVSDILQARGAFDEALRIRLEEQLPVYERLGDVRSKAVARGRIADILQLRGALDEALRIRGDEELPVYEQLGDLRSKAVTQGKVADILQARGQLEEALALQEERLPVAERMGDIESIAHIKYSTALLRLQLGQHTSGGLQRIHDDLTEAFAISRQLGRPDGIGWVGQLLASVLATSGERDHALQVLALAEAAFVKLEDAAGMAQVRDLRAAIGAG